MADAQKPPVPLIVSFLFLLIIVLLNFPILYLAVSSVLSNNEFTLKWYAKLVENDEWLEAFNKSLVLALSSSFASAVLGTMSAIGFWKKKNFGTGFFANLSIILPELVFALSLLSWFAYLKLNLGFFTLFVSHVTFTVGLAFFVIRSRLERFDRKIEEAAIDLGATSSQVLFRVVLPLIKTSIFAAFLICFLVSFDDFLISYFVAGVGYETLPMKLYFSMKIGLSQELNALATIITVLSGLIIYLASRQYSES